MITHHLFLFFHEAQLFLKMIKNFCYSRLHHVLSTSFRQQYRYYHEKLRQSYYYHASSLPLYYRTAGQRLDDLTHLFPEHECFVFKSENNKRYTYKSFKDEVDSIALSLLKLGFEKNDRLGVWLPNTSENVMMTYACSKLGIIKVHINPAYMDRELDYCLNKVGCKGLVLQSNIKKIDCLNILKKLIPELAYSKPNDMSLISKSIPSLKHVILINGSSVKTNSDGFHSFNDLLNKGANGRHSDLFERQKLINCDHPLSIFFTSGTTGHPKAATLTNFNLINNGHIFKHLYPDSSMSKTCCPIPLFHIFGEVFGTLNIINDKFTTVFPAILPDTLATIKAIHEEKCTSLIGAPIIFQDIYSYADRRQYNLSSLLFAIIGAAPSSPQLLDTLEQKLPIKRIAQGYGMTETSATATMSIFAHDDKKKRFGSVGKAMPHLEVKLVNNNGETVPIGEEGEIYVRGYSVMKGYWGDEEKTRETLTDTHWLKTGDVATMDENGYLYFRSRQKDLVIIGGINVYPVEVEHTLAEHPKIAQAQVFGVPDKRYGEQLCAWIKLKQNYGENDVSIEDIKAFLSERVAFFKIPKHIKIVDSYQQYTTPTGKVQKYKLTETMVKELNS
ncbi:unnamed protein product [Didymodactylos carnosus]|uniref:Medium-chain acyl-CoA ligase ACSF2, mitochondrial n=1 Tax=Didymodactylos carnosus TaxID=1234261 RepID=A0A814YUA8_9BILA|nr:unnamed protein product [Didymodactylos carnosus]CAF1414524.1 unnamed protein product [Didymodactylos carnosus]CAF3998213.1 unnamed protein product [Didymodactylos carnosus]CAF4217393.1 unnamed protein product [Didymodactylos carnosus]